MPEISTESGGRELAYTSFLGPFLSISLFAEDDSKVIDRLMIFNTLADKTGLIGSLRQEMQTTRVSIYNSTVIVKYYNK